MPPVIKAVDPVPRSTTWLNAIRSEHSSSKLRAPANLLQLQSLARQTGLKMLSRKPLDLDLWPLDFLSKVCKSVDSCIKVKDDSKKLPEDHLDVMKSSFVFEKSDLQSYSHDVSIRPWKKSEQFYFRLACSTANSKTRDLVTERVLCIVTRHRQNEAFLWMSGVSAVIFSHAWKDL